MPPARRTKRTNLRDSALGKGTVPLVFNLGDLVALGVDQDLAVDHLLLADALDDVSSFHVHLDRVPGVCDFVVQTLDLGERGL